MGKVILHSTYYDESRGELIELELQDRSKWDKELIGLGTKYLSLVARDRVPTRFMLEAGIAFTHCSEITFNNTNWRVILGLYQKLRMANPSPFTELNCSIAVLHAEGASLPSSGEQQVPKPVT